ncbi:MAG: glutathione S-transferase family protein [Plectolyngbya sp. WJT66-NPBG17]|jgi:glutathione S-transferase|nr:glutathione S-transferase family protein [Plectolyngbya sp. WJT66-NPBG17]
MNTPLPQLELISHHLCPYVQRAVITLLEKNIPHDRAYIDLANKPDWFRQISPLGKVPLLKINHDVLFESAVICEYLDEITPDSLHPNNPLERAKHRAWIEFGSGILNAIASLYNAPDKAAFEQKQQEIVAKFDRIEGSVNGSYFAGERFSLVDAVYGPIFRYFDVLENHSQLDFFTNTPTVKRWRQALQNRPSIQTAVEPDYPQRLLSFFKQRDSYLSTLLAS